MRKIIKVLNEKCSFSININYILFILFHLSYLFLFHLLFLAAAALLFLVILSQRYRAIAAIIHIRVVLLHLLGAQLNPWERPRVNRPAVHLRHDLLCRPDERLLHIHRGFRRSLHEDKPVVPREGLALLPGDAALVVQVGLVPDDDHHHLGRPELTDLLEPLPEVVEGVTAGDVVDEEGRSSPAVVGTSDRTEGLLAGSVPDLEVGCFSVNLYDSGPEPIWEKRGK